uniref:Uncharacterized protein n=1 Tax=Cacopsylla melanoneura TaxID=428564 RepID=A0A8D8Y6M2_9HEMI
MMKKKKKIILLPTYFYLKKKLSLQHQFFLTWHHHYLFLIIKFLQYLMHFFPTIIITPQLVYWLTSHFITLRPCQTELSAFILCKCLDRSLFLVEQTIDSLLDIVQMVQ